MKKLKKLLISPLGTTILFILSAALLLTGSIGGARAALTEISEDYVSHLPLKHIGIALWENEVDVSNDRLLERMLAEGEALQPGRVYPEVLQVQNRGTIDEYVRVSVYRYWTDQAGNKRVDLSPELIELSYVNGDKWLMDTAAETRERTVFYYSTALAPNGFSVPFIDTIAVNGNILDDVQTKDLGNGKLQFIYTFDGAHLVLDVQADGVQTHNGEDAVRSAWGPRVTISGGVLSLRYGQTTSDGTNNGAVSITNQP